LKQDFADEIARDADKEKFDESLKVLSVIHQFT